MSTGRQKVKIHGLAVNLSINIINKIFLADFTFAIPCFKWPPESDWPFPNKMWPDRKVVLTIKNRDFHFVPKNKKTTSNRFFTH